MILSLIIVACILLALAAANVPSGPVSLGWLGMFFYVLAQIWDKV